MFNIAWGVGNKTYLPLLCLIPIINIIWPFICGFKGNEWAWVSGSFTTSEIEKFQAIQKTWNRSGLVWFILVIASMVLFFISIMSIIFILANNF